MSDFLSINNILFTVPWFDYKLSLVELWSTILGLWCVIAFRKGSVWAYPIGIVNSIGFIAIVYQIQLYSDLLLNLYFIGMSFAGWVWWLRKGESGKPELQIRYMDWNNRVAFAGVMLLSTYFLGLNIDMIFNELAQVVATILGTTYTHVPAALPFWDASTTVMSIAAMYLLARKHVEAWILWVVVNIVCIGLYYYKGALFLSLEYCVFLVNALMAVYQWHKLSKGVNR